MKESAIKNFIRSLAMLGLLAAWTSIAKAGPVGPPNGPPYDPSTVILNQTTRQTGKTANLSSATVSNLLTSTVTANAVILNGVTFTTVPVSGTSVYPATATIVASKGISATTMTLTGLMNGTTVTITGLFTGTVIHGSSAVITGTVTGSNLTGTNRGDVTIGTGSGLSISGQVLSMTTASTVSTGSLRAFDFSTFNNKLDPDGDGSALTGLTKTQVGLNNVQNVDQTNATNLTSGTVGTARLGSGTASTSRYLRGDSSWQLLNSTAAGLGNVTNNAQVKISDYTQKGAILVGISTGVLSVLAPGNNGTILAADSTQASGYKFVISPVSFTVYPASSTASFPYGFSATTATISRTLTVATATISGTLTGNVINFISGSASGEFTSLNLTGTNTGDVSIGLASGLSLNGQTLSLSTATATSTGALTSTDFARFDSKGSSFTVQAPITFGTGVIAIDKSSATLLGPAPTTTSIPEGSNLYYTTARATSAISAPTPLSYSNGVVGVSASSVTLQGNTFNAASKLVQLDSNAAINLTSGTITAFNSTTVNVTSGTVGILNTSTFGATNLEANVVAYGAIGNNSTNDYTSFVNALNSGRGVYMPKGTYVLSSNLSLPRYGGIHGDIGGQSIFSGTVYFASNTVVRDFGSTTSSQFVNHTASVSGVTIDNANLTSGSFSAVDIESNTVSDVTIKDSKIVGSASAVLVNGNSGGSNFRLVNSSVTGLVSDSFGINEPNVTFKGFIITGNFASSYASTTTSTGGFGMSNAAAENGIFANNVISDAGNEGIHLEDAQKNNIINSNVIISRRKGIGIYHVDSGNLNPNQPPIITSNQIQSNPLYIGTSYGIFLQNGPTGTMSGSIISNNHIKDFFDGVYIGALVTGQKAAISYVDGNSIDNSTNAIASAGSGTTGEVRQYGVNISSNVQYLFYPGSGHTSFGKVYSSSFVTAVSSSPNYGGQMPSSMDGFGYPLSTVSTSGTGISEALWNLFPAASSQRFFGRCRVRARTTTAASWFYISADLKWDGTTLTVLNQIDREGTVFSNPTFEVTGGNLRLDVASSAVRSVDAAFVEFDGEYWDQ